MLLAPTAVPLNEPFLEPFQESFLGTVFISTNYVVPSPRPPPFSCANPSPDFRTVSGNGLYLNHCSRTRRHLNRSQEWFSYQPLFFTPNATPSDHSQEPFLLNHSKHHPTLPSISFDSSNRSQERILINHCFHTQRHDFEPLCFNHCPLSHSALPNPPYGFSNRS